MRCSKPRSPNFRCPVRSSIRMIIKRLKSPGILFAAIGAVLAAVLGGARVASAASGQVIHQDVTGAVFSCNDGSTYTVLSGEAMFLLHQSVDKAGGFHITGTIAPTQV